MIKWLKQKFGVSELEEKIRLLTELNAGLTKEIGGYRNQPQKYSQLEIPQADSLKRALSDIHSSPTIAFYLMALENEILEMFRTGKGEEIYRGGLNTLRRIRDDSFNAYREVQKDAAKV